jgi:hypothetical protein
MDETPESAEPESADQLLERIRAERKHKSEAERAAMTRWQRFWNPKSMDGFSKVTFVEVLQWILILGVVGVGMYGAGLAIELLVPLNLLVGLLAGLILWAVIFAFSFGLLGNAVNWLVTSWFEIDDEEGWKMGFLVGVIHSLIATLIITLIISDSVR